MFYVLLQRKTFPNKSSNLEACIKRETFLSTVSYKQAITGQGLFSELTSILYTILKYTTSIYQNFKTSCNSIKDCYSKKLGKSAFLKSHQRISSENLCTSQRKFGFEDKKTHFYDKFYFLKESTRLMQSCRFRAWLGSGSSLRLPKYVGPISGLLRNLLTNFVATTDITSHR